MILRFGVLEGKMLANVAVNPKSTRLLLFQSRQGEQILQPSRQRLTLLMPDVKERNLIRFVYISVLVCQNVLRY